MVGTGAAMIDYQPKHPVSVVFKGSATSVPSDVLGGWEHGLFVTCDDGDYIVLRDRYSARLERRVSASSRATTDIVNKALRLLVETDHIEFRTPTPQRTPSIAWLAWREQLREVGRGNATEIPPEPERYNTP